ncbi:TraX family protein [Azotobacter chroococcum]|uniref:TraX family protein n=1 Tax=Azotobacter chroococcum TaxID=353 RepID=UPI0030B8A439
MPLLRLTAGAERLAGPFAAREAALDLLKWLAFASMLLDHLRLIWPARIWLYVPGRLAFPFFCLIVAVNLARPRAGPPRRAALARYLGWLLLFALLSEWPYRLLVGSPDSFNVLPTLALGLLLANAARPCPPAERLLGVAALGLALVLHKRLMFGACGALLPAAFLLALQRPRWGWLLPAGLTVMANYWPALYIDARLGQPFALAVILACFLAAPLGLLLLRRAPGLPVPPLRRWAYAFYPGHFLLLHGLREWLQRGG